MILQTRTNDYGRKIEISFIEISKQEEEIRTKRIQDILIKALVKEKIKSEVINNQKEV